MKKALIIGIDNYKNYPPLSGCVADAKRVFSVLEKHENGDLNFVTPRLIVGDNSNVIDRSCLKDAVVKLFDYDSDIALFYFAGHGFIEDLGGYLCPSDAVRGDDGFSLYELMSFASHSKAKNIIIFLDCCHSGNIGENPNNPKITEIRNGTAILAACTTDQFAMEKNNGYSGGVFTQILVDALRGSAANLVGDVTPGSVYAHIDQSFGPWAGQRPIFKANVKSFVSLRKTNPPIKLEELRSIAEHFDNQDEMELNPTFEPERNREQEENADIPPPDNENTRKFAQLQSLVKVNLVRPVNAPHMWHAAMESKTCELTSLGKHYRKLVKDGLI